MEPKPAPLNSPTERGVARKGGELLFDEAMFRAD